jgi:hypothetical protein
LRLFISIIFWPPEPVKSSISFVGVSFQVNLYRVSNCLQESVQPNAFWCSTRANSQTYQMYMTQGEPLYLKLIRLGASILSNQHSTLLLLAVPINIKVVLAFRAWLWYFCRLCGFRVFLFYNRNCCWFCAYLHSVELSSLRIVNDQRLLNGYISLKCAIMLGLSKCTACLTKYFM